MYNIIIKWNNIDIENKIKGYSHHDDCMPHDKYVKWQRNCLTEMLRIISESGAIFYNHKWRVQAGLLQDRQDIVSGFPVRQIIIWKRKGGLNFNPGYFLPTYEVIYLIAKPKFKLAEKANAYGDVWEFTQEMKNDHPAAFPVSLINRIINSTDAKIVLDPFIGSETAAISLNIKIMFLCYNNDMENKFMEHRHINLDPKKPLPLEAIDDIISRGDMNSWLKLRDYCLNHPEALDDVLKITSRYISDPYEQKYHLWHNLSLFLKKGGEGNEK